MKITLTILSRVLAVGFAPLTAFILDNIGYNSDFFVSIWLLVALFAIVDQSICYTDARSLSDKSQKHIAIVNLPKFFYFCIIIFSLVLVGNLFFFTTITTGIVVLSLFGISFAALNSLIVFKTVFNDPFTSLLFRLFLGMCFIMLISLGLDVEVVMGVAALCASIFFFSEINKLQIQLNLYSIFLTKFFKNSLISLLGLSLVQVDKYMIWILDAQFLAEYYLTYSLIFAPMFGFWIPLIATIKPNGHLSPNFTYLPVMALTTQFLYIFTIDAALTYFNSTSLLSSNDGGTLILYLASLAGAAALKGLILGFSNGALEVFGRRNFITFLIGIFYIFIIHLFDYSAVHNAAGFCLIVNAVHLLLSCYLDWSKKIKSVMFLTYYLTLAFVLYYFITPGIQST